MPAEKSLDLVVIGAGPGGYVGAIRAAQLGFTVACVEKWPTLGGTCLNIGCIPSKALLDSTELFDQIHHKAAVHGIKVGAPAIDVATMMARKDKVVTANVKGVEFLFRKHKIEWLHGTGKLVAPDRIEVTDAEGNTQTVTAQRVLLATGSEPIPFPDVPFDEERVLSSTGTLALLKVPKHLIVIGGGVIGMELGSVWQRLGAQVTILELMPTILPGLDEEIVKQADRSFRKQGFELRAGVKVAGIQCPPRGKEVRVSLEGGEEIVGDRCLVAIGRRPYTQGLGAEEIGVKFGPRGAIQVDDRYHTGIGQIYAIGDTIGGRLLAHEAMEEGVAAVENMAGLPGHVEYNAVANVVYTWPEIASVGKTEAELREAGHELKIGRYNFSALGRARAMEETEGFVKVIADARTDRVLGLHIFGPRASDLIAEPALAMEFHAAAEDIGISVHAHPTLPEAIKEAALDAIGRAIHK